MYTSNCLLPRHDDYWGSRWNFASWKMVPHFRAGAYKRAGNRYDRCVENLALGRKKFQLAADCGPDPVTGKYSCSLTTGGVKTSTSQIVGASQSGLSQDQGSLMQQFEKIDKRILIGTGVALVLLLRR